MNIKEAKQQVKYTVKSYLTQNEDGKYIVSVEKQRPIFLMGPPGIGKTAIMQQVADELGINLVSYSMTHHTRQSALGLPFITDKVYDGKTVRVSEYTMSEIISSMYDKEEETGRKEGILFLDEINCVSETLAPSMLQFLQFKTFGRHRIPDGWVVVTAGNPPAYNDSVREFDIVTWDRLKRIDVEPDYPVWKEYAYRYHIHPAIISYLNARPQDFYLVQTTVDGKSFVTARGWEDLSTIIRLYEQNDFPVDINLMSQYLQNSRIAEEFAIYYSLYNKYKSDYQIDQILDGNVSDDIVERAKVARFDERLTVLGLLLDNLGNDFNTIYEKEETLRPLVREFRERKAVIQGATPDKAMDTLKEIQKRICMLNYGEDSKPAQDKINAIIDEVRRSSPNSGMGVYNVILSEMSKENAARKDLVTRTGSRLHNLFEFVKRTFGTENEMLILVTELTSNYYASNFISHYGCEDYFTYNKDLMFYERQKEITKEISDLDMD